MSDVSRETSEEVSETSFVLTSAPERLASLSSVPQSPKRAFEAAGAIGWETVIWSSAGQVPPTLYVSNSDEHSVGDVLYDGYAATLYVVEARDPETRAIGFQAFFLGKFYGEGDKRNSKGSFDFARVADPIGMPLKLSAEYKPIPVTQGKGELESSYRVRVGRSKKTAADMSQSYNTRRYFWRKRFIFTASKQFDKWLDEWASFAPKGTL